MKAKPVVAILGAAVVAVLVTTSVQLQNLRILTSWHGFLHSAIANRFPGPFQTPENPFFAGERLPYYWVYHYIASFISRTAGTDPIHAFQIITVAGMVALWIGAGVIGVRRFGSVTTGLLIGFLALAGVNPLGPAIALGKYVIQDQPLIDSPTIANDSDTAFVTEQHSGELMTQPLLASLYFSADWRRGQNVVWYLDNSSRGVAVGLILPLLCVFTAGTFSWGAAISIALIAAVMTAVNPLIGLAAVGSILGGTVLVTLLRGKNTFPLLGLAIAGMLGALAASPTYYHLFLAGGSGSGVPLVQHMMVKAVAIAFNVVVLLPLALWAAIRESEWRNRNQALVLAAGALLSVVPFITLPDDTEHNLVNVAQALLVVPAVTAIATLHALPWKRVALTAAFVPMTAGSLLSYLGRPPLPIAFERGELHRTSKEGLEKLYTWIRTSTTPDAVFVVDAGRPAKMSGNVSELPAFTGRTLFVDTPTYMTTPHKDFEQRSGLSKRLTSGEALTGQDATYVTALNRPIYLISYSADKEDLLNRMTQLYGAPFFHEGFIAVFDLMATHHVNPI